MPWSVKSTKNELLASGHKRKYIEKPNGPLIWDSEGLEAGLEDVVRMERLGSNDQTSGHKMNPRNLFTYQPLGRIWKPFKILVLSKINFYKKFADEKMCYSCH